MSKRYPTSAITTITTLMMRFLTCLMLLVSQSLAFSVIRRPTSPTFSSLSSVKHLNEIDEMCIENAAAYCIDNELVATDCDLEEHEALILTLTRQREYHMEQVHAAHKLMRQLRGKDDELEQRAIERVRQHHLNEVDEMCVENAAVYCLEASSESVECNVDEMEALLNTLQEQSEYHLGHLETINGLLMDIQ